MRNDRPAPQDTGDSQTAERGFRDPRETMPRFVLPLLIGSLAAVIGAIVLTCVLYARLTTHLGYLGQEAENRTAILESRLAALEATSRMTQSNAETGGTDPRHNADNAGIDVTVPVMQEIGFGFLTTHLSVEQLPGGAGLRGRIVNSTSLDHKNAKFRVRAADTTRDFTVPTLPAGSSSKFDVYVPGITAKEVKRIFIDYLESAVAYSRDG